MENLISAGSFAGYRIYRWSEADFAPKDTCKSGRFGFSCTPCRQCPGSMSCDDGARGSGNCLCRFVWASGIPQDIQLPAAVGTCLAVSRSNISFPNTNAGSSSEVSVKITNVGTTEARIGLFLISPPDEDLLPQFPEVPLTIAAGAAITFPITFEPRGKKNISSVLSILYDIDDTINSDDEFVRIPISGKGIGNSVSPNPVPGDDDLGYKYQGKYHYQRVLYQNYLFYHLQRSGEIKPSQRRAAWRDTSCMDCIGNFGEDLTGGYYEAGNYLKITSHMAVSLSQIGWSLVFFKKGHESAGQLQEGIDTLAHGADFIVKGFDENSERLVAQVGKSSLDFVYYGNPENYSTFLKQMNVAKRDVFYVTPSSPGAEILADSASALALASIAIEQSNPAKSAVYESTAIKLFALAEKYPVSYMDSPALADTAKLYPSTDFTDEMAFAAIWLFNATGDYTYLTKARNWYKEECFKYPGWAYSWDDKCPALHVLLSYYDFQGTKGDRDLYEERAKGYFNEWLPGRSRIIPHTPLGLAFRNRWGSLRYASNTAFLAFAYAKTLTDIQPPETRETFYIRALENYAESQANYILGDGGRSWIVGYGKSFPKFVWVKSSYNSMLYFPLSKLNPSIAADRKALGNDFKFSSRPNTFPIHGALVGGPLEVNGVPSDSWVDSRSSFVYAEITLDYNAAWTGVVARLSELYSGDQINDCKLDLGWNYTSGLVRPVNKYTKAEVSPRIAGTHN